MQSRAGRASSQAKNRWQSLIRRVAGMPSGWEYRSKGQTKRTLDLGSDGLNTLQYAATGPAQSCGLHSVWCVRLAAEFAFDGWNSDHPTDDRRGAIARPRPRARVLRLTNATAIATGLARLGRR